MYSSSCMAQITVCKSAKVSWYLRIMLIRWQILITSVKWSKLVKTIYKLRKSNTYKNSHLTFLNMNKALSLTLQWQVYEKTIGTPSIKSHHLLWTIKNITFHPRHFSFYSNDLSYYSFPTLHTVCAIWASLPWTNWYQNFNNFSMNC